MNKPTIALIYENNLSSELFVDFKNALHNENVNVNIEPRPPLGPQACLEWFIIPAVGIWITQAYFSAVLGEMGKDHYLLLKNKISHTAKEIISQPKIEPTLYGSTGKIDSENPYSAAFAIYAETNDNKKFKLLIPKASTHDNNYDEIIKVFLDYVSDYHSGIKDLNSIGFDRNYKPTGGIIFVHVDPSTKKLEWLDVRPQIINN